MSENKYLLVKHSLTWGAIGGTLLVILSLAFYMLEIEMSNNKVFQYAQILIILAFVVISQIQFRSAGNYFSYARILGVASLTGVFAAFIIGTYNFVFFKLIAPDLMDHIKQQAELALIERDMPQEALDAALKAQGKFLKPWVMSVMSIIQMSFLSFVTALLSSAFIKPKKSAGKIYENNIEENTEENQS